jgi:hypothetical protein
MKLLFVAFFLLGAAQGDVLHRIDFLLGSAEQVPVSIETSFGPQAAMGSAKQFCTKNLVKDVSCPDKIYRMIMDKAAYLHEASRSKRSLVLAMKERTAEQDARKFCAANSLSPKLCEELVARLPHFLAHRKQQCKVWPTQHRAKNIIFSTVPKSGTTITLLLLNSVSKMLGIDAVYPHDELIASEMARTGDKFEHEGAHFRVIKTHFPFQSVCRGPSQPSCILHMVRNPIDNFASYAHYANHWLLPRINKLVSTNEWSKWHASSWRPSSTNFTIFMQKWEIHHR